MSHKRIPFTTQSNSRYGTAPTSSIYNTSNTSFSKPNMSFGANHSLNTSYTNGNASLLYANNKTKKMSSRNRCNHSFSIPIECGKPRNCENLDSELWSNPHFTKLKPGNNRRIVCGGLQWDIYIHPNQGENSNEFALSVFPVRTSTEDKLPETYKLKYTVSTSLNQRSAVNARQNDDDQKSLNQFDDKWSREISDIVYDANPKDIAGNNRSTDSPQIDWRSIMERLSFSTQDLYQSHCEDDGYFTLYISIHTEYIKKPSRRSSYFGVLGAILLQSESKMDEQCKQIDALNHGKDGLVMELRSQLQEANKLNTSLSDNYSKITQEMKGMNDAMQTFVVKERQNIQQREREIEKLRSEIQEKHDEIRRLSEKTIRMTEQMNNQEILYQTQLQQIQQMQQQRQAVQSQQNQQQYLLQQRQNLLQQQWMNQNQQQIHPQPIPQQPPQPQQQPITNPFGGNNDSNNSPNIVSPQRSAKLAGQQISSYQQYPTDSPQQQMDVNARKSSDTVLIASPSQTTTSNRSQSENQYVARMVTQPNFNQQSQEQSPIVSNITNKFNTMTVVSPPKPSLGPQSPQQIPPNIQSSQVVESKEDTIPNFGNLPNLEVMEDHKEQRMEESKQEILSHNKPEPKSPVPEPPLISEQIDPEFDEAVFQHRPVRAWRWDTEQNKWRGRGKGQMTVYYNSSTGLARLVFMDEKHNKVRLLQWIDGEEPAQYPQNGDDVTPEEVEWNGADYVMDKNDPMVGMWKVAFVDNEDAAKLFLQIFNDNLNAYQGRDDISNDRQQQNQEASTTAPIDDQDEAASVDSNKPFAFDINAEKPAESFGAGTGGMGDFNTNASWASAFGNNSSFLSSSNNAQNTDTTDNSFSNIQWNMDAPQIDQQQPSESKVSEPVKQDDEEDNGLQHTFKPIAHLEEQKVDTGHENETLIEEFAFVKLYRFGTDVSNLPCWKNRASASKVGFYKSKDTGKIRMISREHETNKLRMNQFVPRPSNSKFDQRQPKVYQWSAYDASIAAEEEDENSGFTQWCIKFESTEIADQFRQTFADSSISNESVGSPSKPSQKAQQKEQSQEVESSKPVDKIIDNQDDNKVAADADGHGDDEEKYKGWSQEEIALDKQRIQKAKEAAETAKLFAGNNDDTNQNMSWNIAAFDTSAANVGGQGSFKFDENQRGVDLEVERQLNRIGNDTSISFGVSNNNETGQEPDFSNVTTRENDNNDNADNAGWNNNFSFVADKKKDDETENVEVAPPKPEEETNFAGWNIGSGGFSDVQTTDGFGNASWGNTGNDGGFGSFDANFNFDSLITKQSNETAAEEEKQSEQRDNNNNKKNDENQNEAATEETANDDNCKDITFKPLVNLQEVTVESGHENEKKLQDFEIIKLYRWGKDVSNQPCWKNRASKTKISFYQHNSSGKIRIVCRENITNKLRLNQLITGKISNVEKKNAKQVSWSAIDVTIAQEDDNDGVCMFAAKFAEPEIADNFVELFKSSCSNNDAINS